MNLLRRPGTTMSPDQMTGDAVLDGFLRDLDAALFGSRKVRALHVAEARDHLLEAREARLEQGLDAEAASRAAVSDFGDAREHAEGQRYLLRTRFWQTAMTAGPLFALGMFAFEVLQGGHATESMTASLVTSMIQGVFFGAFMGWWVAFIHPARVLPGPEAGAGTFVCAYPPRMQKLSYFWMVVFAGCVVTGAGAALQVDALNPLGFSEPAAILLGLLAVVNLRMMRTATQKVVVDERGIEVRKLLRRERVSWSQLRSLRLLGERKSWIPRWNYWSRVRELEYAGPTGATRTLKLFPDAENSDRLACLLRDKLGERPDRH